MLDTIKIYYGLTKPGIIYGNIINATGGFLLASQGIINGKLLLALLSGTSLVIASACVINNFIDRTIDKKMARTKDRALVVGKISGRHALTYAAILGCIGFFVLTAFTNALVVLIGIVGFVAYLVLYGVGKRQSVQGTLIGSISGATPPVAGYCAVTGSLDTAAALLFAILVLWQMPHFYAIATYRRTDYAAAGVPVLPVVRGIKTTKLHILLYVAGFGIATSMLTVTGYTGYTYLVAMTAVSAAWLAYGLSGYRTQDDNRWARKMFSFSLIVTLIFSIMISVDTWLP